MPFKFNPLTGSIDSVNSRSEDVTFGGEINAKKLTLSDDGAASPIFMLKTDDTNPWGFIIKNDGYTTDEAIGFKAYQANNGDFHIEHRGDASYNNFYFKQYNGTTSRTALSIDTNGDANFSGKLEVTGNIKMAATKGIQFSPYDETVSNPGSDSNTLDDYEEGTWEPTITSGSTVTSYNGARTGRYTKIGRMVTCHFNLGFTGTANGDQLKIGNLPFTDADVGALGGGQIIWTSLPTLTTSDGISLLVSNGTTTIECYDGVNPTLTIANTTSISSKVLYGIVTYEAA